MKSGTSLKGTTQVTRRIGLVAAFSKPEAAELAKKEQQEKLPDAATQTREERVAGTRKAIQDEFKERATKDPAQFRKQIEEAYPDADKAKIDELIKKAEEGNFPVPENVRFVAEGDEALGSGKSKFDSEKNELIMISAQANAIPTTVRTELTGRRSSRTSTTFSPAR